MKKDVIELSVFTREEIDSLLALADAIKKNPGAYAEKMKGKTLLMIFDRPSLRTRVSFEVGMTQMGGHAIYYSVADSPLGKKETMSDTAKTASRYVDLIMARITAHEELIDLAQNATVPVINALTNRAHPCQILADLQTIREKKGSLAGLQLAYLGDSDNNVTYSLMYGCALMGITMSIGCPEGEQYMPRQEIADDVRTLAAQSGASLHITHAAPEAIRDADVVYTDSWMSYHIPKEKEAERIAIFKPYQITAELMRQAKPDAVFMNCLPAMRGMEQTAEVIDGPQSIVFDQAENRLHAQKALMLRLLGLS